MELVSLVIEIFEDTIIYAISALSNFTYLLDELCAFFILSLKLWKRLIVACSGPERTVTAMISVRIKTELISNHPTY